MEVKSAPKPRVRILNVEDFTSATGISCVVGYRSLPTSLVTSRAMGTSRVTATSPATATSRSPPTGITSPPTDTRPPTGSRYVLPGPCHDVLLLMNQIVHTIVVFVSQLWSTKAALLHRTYCWTSFIASSYDSLVASGYSTTHNRRH